MKYVSSKQEILQIKTSTDLGNLFQSNQSFPKYLQIFKQNASLDDITQMSPVCCLHILNSSKNIVTVGAGKLFLGCFLCPFPYFQQMRHFCKIHPFLIMLDRKGAYLRLHFCHIFILSSLLLSDHCPPITQGCCCEPNWVFFRYNSISRTLLFNITLGRRGCNHKCRWISSKN